MKEQIIDIKPLEIKEIEVTIRGKSPLIVHNFDEKTKRQMLETQQKKATSVKPIRNPQEEFMRSLHWLTDMPEEFTEEAMQEAINNGAKFGFPADGLKASIVSGAYRNKLTKDQVSVRGAFNIMGEFIEIKGVPEMRNDKVRIAKGATDLRFRAEFKEWTSTFKLQYVENTYSLEQILNFINIGGFSVGIGDWRVEKGGPFGTYEVVGNE